MNPPGRVRALSIHADYGCRHSGACCTAGWRIPVDTTCAGGLQVASLRGLLPRVDLERDAGLAVLPLASSGACVFYRDQPSEEAGRCAMHGALGHEALPLACRQFPRVSLIDPRGTFVTLSHFCPTAASLLFRDGIPLRIVESPPAFPASAEYDGLDARDTLPPLLHPEMLMDLEGYTAWEAAVVQLLGQDDVTPEAALRDAAALTETVRRWRPQDGPLAAYVRAAAAGVPPAGTLRPAHQTWPERVELLELAHASLAERIAARPVAPDYARADDGLVAPRWESFAAPVRRYLAARLFGCWLAYQGRGLRTILHGLETALAVVRLECARACGEAGRPLDRELLTRAVRQADLLLVHEISSLAFARRLSQIEYR